MQSQLEIEIANDFTPDQAETKKKVDTLYDWISSRGADVSKARIRFDGQIYSTASASTFYKGDTIMEIPQSLLITVSMALGTPVGKALMDLGILN